MRIAIDLDGTICPVKQAHQNYGELEPLPGAADRIRALRAAGHYVIIITARNMATCDGNLGKVMKNIGKLTLDWLEKHGIEYDEIYFGKPNAEVYIDDRALRFDRWEDMTDERLAREARER
jgi:capsule biosynthesis phosphatase